MNSTESQNRPSDNPNETDLGPHALSRSPRDRIGQQALQSVHDAGEALQLRAQALADQMRQARDSGSDVIRAHPLRAVALAAGLGASLVLLLGLVARLRSAS